MQENKNLVEEALIQMKNVEEAIAENAKGILASTMKEEINQLVKESLSEQEEVDIDAEIEMPASDEEEMDMDMDVEDDMESDMDMELDMDAEAPIDLTGASDEEILKVFKAMGEEDGIIVTKDDEEIQLTDNDSDNEYIIKLGESKSNTKLTEDETVAKIVDDIFNSPTSMEDEEEIDFSKLTKDGEEDEDEMAMAMDSEEEMMYEITLDEDEDEDSDQEDESMLDEEDGEEDESMLDEESDENDESLDEAYNHKKAIKPKGVGIGNGPKFSYKATKGGFNEKKKEGPKSVGTGKAKFEYKKGANMEGKSKKVETKEGHQGYKDREDERLAMKHGKTSSKDLKGSHSKKEKSRRDDAGFEKRETKEAARTYGMGSKEGRGLRKGITNNRNYVYGTNGVKVESLEAEVSMLREKNEEYRRALNLFREKLNEVAIFNSNLAYATRLFTEHSTTKKEKINILRRFDSVETLKESKSLYKSIKDELSSVDTKSITESVEKLNTTVTSGSAINLIESKTYENPQFLRMKDLMTKIK